MKHYTNQELLDIFTKANKETEKRKFGDKLEIISSLQWALLHSEQFLKDIEKIRKKFGITKDKDLDINSDSYIFLFEDMHKMKTISSSSHSTFWEWRGLVKEQIFNKAVRDFIASYEHVPSFLFHWVRNIIMYDYNMESIHLDGLDFIQYVIGDRINISKLPLTTVEKKYLHLILDKNLGKSNGRFGRPTKANAEIRKQLSNIINSSKKSRFRLGFTDEEKKVFELKKSGQTYKQIVKDLYPERKGIAMAESNRIRQQHLDVNKRVKELTKKVEK
jgi:hypothetical protein